MGTLSEFTYTLKTKYRLIFNIVKHLGGEHKQMKEYILQLIANMFDDIKLLIDVADFQKKLVEAYEIKGLLSSYKNDIIPAPKKSMAVNESKIKNDKRDKYDKKDKVDPPAASKAYSNDLKKDK